MQGDGNVRLVFATWVFRLHGAGVTPADDAVAAACVAVATAPDPKAGEVAAAAFVDEAGRLLAGSDPPAVLASARALYGDRVASDLGEGSRSDRTSRIRRYQFAQPRPWLARIVERLPSGIGPSWLLVEQVADQVRAMDPNPWNDVDERRHIPLADFHVLWELDGCASVYVR